MTANGTRARFDRLNPAPFAIDIGTSENLALNANGGDDSFSATGNLAALVPDHVDGGAGDETILGSNGVDVLLGGDGGDFVDGEQGNDVALLGAGTTPSSGIRATAAIRSRSGRHRHDAVQRLRRRQLFAASANGGRVLFTRTWSSIAMDLDDVETIDLMLWAAPTRPP